jgi:hypothetical protein
MAVKTSGSQWKRFYADQDEWPSGMYHEDEDFLVDGEEIGDRSLDDVPDGAIIVLDGGIVWNEDNEDVGTLEEKFQKWLRRSDVSTLVVEVEKGKEKALRAAIKKAGGKVL